LENFTLKSSDAAAITRKLAETLDFIHTLGFVIGPLTCEEVVLKLTSTGVSFEEKKRKKFNLFMLLFNNARE
jgi:hypothetical protein